jgi:single-stranded DNA-binding protein
MSTRTITGRLAADPVVQKAGRMDITKFTVMENTGRYRAGEWVADDAATPHHVEAKFELGAAAAGLHKGDLVIVVGYERTNTWTKDGAAQYKRVIEADQIGTSITNGRNGTRNTTEPLTPRDGKWPQWGRLRTPTPPVAVSSATAMTSQRSSKKPGWISPKHRPAAMSWRSRKRCGLSWISKRPKRTGCCRNRCMAGP